MGEKNGKFFVSTAIDYPSAKPHLGHCLERVQADVIARYKKESGFDVHFSIGLDEHGLKIQRAAEKAGKKPQDFVDEISGFFKDLWRKLNISNNDFIRTTEKRHEKVVKEIIKKLQDKGDIYKGKYKGLYCVDCETYYLPKDLAEGKCPVHQKPAELIEEDSYFFRTSKYQEQIVRHIQENDNFIVPGTRKNEILSRLKEPLQDLSITRAKVDWGIPFPLNRDLSVFVWVDALLNYFTTIGYPGKKFKKFWPADVHVVGKDITWHHCVIWSSLLLSLGLPLPKTIFVHGYLTSKGQKMSKSLGNVVDPFELVEKYGTDAVRYFLLKEISPTEDGDFTEEKFKDRYNSDLASGLGNLVARTLALAEGKNYELGIRNQELNGAINKAQGDYKSALDNFKFNEALGTIWQLIGFCDKYIEQERPWEKSDNRLSVINDLLLTIGEITELLKPFLPETSEKIAKQLKSKRAEPLFPRIK